MFPVCRHGGSVFTVDYSFVESPFGEIIIASTTTGICYLAFVDGRDAAQSRLSRLFPDADCRELSNEIHRDALRLITQADSTSTPLTLHLRGTDFQLAVWETLLKIPFGQLKTYGEIAAALHRPKAYRAVGNAVGDNPVAVLIPCHRVILSSGGMGGYRWGVHRKAAILRREGVVIN
jgi:AraC family transcriptional regulator of adaptative response/methylated-DNA-[protein]-cysteine methyltransferase